MDPLHEERRLTTILSADVVGYSRLMAIDETGTLARLVAHRKELIEPKTAEYRGRVVKLMGDGTLMEFASVVDAVLFAVEFQRAMVARNAKVPKDQQIIYRVGINIGDIIVVGDDIYGDGVNVAARLQELAEPGGICISRSVHNQVKNKVDFGFKDMGEQNVKNIPDAIPTYKIWWESEPTVPLATARLTGKPLWRRPLVLAVIAVVVIGATITWALFLREVTPPIAAASLERMALPMPEKPSIAVLPFETSQLDRSRRLLVYGLVDTIVADLARTSSLFVIAQHSSLQDEYSAFKPREAAELFGVRHVLAGRVVGNGNDLTIEVQLIDTIGGRQLWRQTLEGDTDDLYRIQSEIVNHVRTTLEGDPGSEASARSDARLQSHSPHGEPYAHLLQGIAHFRNATPGDNRNAAQLFTKAIEADPENALAYSWKAWNDVFGVMMGWIDAPEERMQRAFTSALESVSLDPTSGFGRWALGATFMTVGDQASALEQFRLGLKLIPDDPDLLAGATKSLAFQGVAPEAIEFGQRALRLNPRPPNWYFWNLGIANYFARRFEEAIAVLEKASNQNTESRLYLVGSYIRSDRRSDAKLQVDEIIRKDPAFHIARYVDRTTFANPNDKVLFVTDLRSAGLSDNVSFNCMLEPSYENCR